MNLQKKETTKLPAVKKITWDFSGFHNFFKSELNCSYTDSSYNLPVPRAAKGPDGSIVNPYARKFQTWSAFEHKCIVKSCVTKHNSPYELLLHKQNYHQNHSSSFVRCQICQTRVNFTFLEYIKHVVDNHCKHLRYW